MRFVDNGGPGGRSGGHWPRRARIAAGVAGMGVALFGYGLAFSVISGVNSYDESWSLQVVDRMLHGDVLYRDIFYGVTPLSAYLMAALARVFGSELAVIKASNALAFALTGLALLLTGRTLRLGRGACAALLIAYAGFCYPFATGTYTPLAVLFTILALAGCLALSRALDHGGQARVVIPLATLIGGCAGLAFLSKQNTGAYCAAAIAASFAALLAGRPRDRLWVMIGVGIVAILSFAVVSAIGLLPVVGSGGWAAFIDYGFANKSTYLAQSGLGYFEEMLAPLQRADLDTWTKSRVLYEQAVFALAPLSLILIAALAIGRLALRHGGTHFAVLATLFAFSTAGFVNVFPRADFAHVNAAMPTALIAIAAIGQALLSRQQRIGGALRWACLVLGLLAIVNSAQLRLRALSDGSLIAIPFPHFSGMLFPKADSLWLFPKLAEYAANRQGQPPLFLMIANAGFTYLATNTANPTPFDYPLVTAFGRTGEADVIRALENGALSGLCRQPYLYGVEGLRPLALDAFVERSMRPVRDLGVCTLYTLSGK